MTAVNNVPDFRVTLDGIDLTDRIRPRLITLRLSERRGGDPRGLPPGTGDAVMAAPAAASLSLRSRVVLVIAASILAWILALAAAAAAVRS